MKTIIAGSRDIISYDEVVAAVKASGFTITEVVSGCARGVDRLGERYGRGNDIPITKFPAEWDRLGKSAGFRRNEEMAKYADAAVILWDGTSKGTGHMVDYATKLGLKVHVHHVSSGTTCTETGTILLTSYFRFNKQLDREPFCISRSAPKNFKQFSKIEEAMPGSWELIELGRRDFAAYTKQFLAELNVDALLHRVNKEIAKNGTIALLCWCRDPNVCHRSLIGKVLRERGFKVRVE